MIDVPQYWYAAHCIMSLRVIGGPQSEYPVYENIILIRAGNSREAWELARARAAADETDSRGTLRFNENDDRPARWTFEGVRKIVECDESETQPRHGVEVSYSEFLLASEHDLARLVSGESVMLRYDD